MEFISKTTLLSFPRRRESMRFDKLTMTCHPEPVEGGCPIKTFGLVRSTQNAVRFCFLTQNAVRSTLFVVRYLRRGI